MTSLFSLPIDLNDTFPLFIPSVWVPMCLCAWVSLALAASVCTFYILLPFLKLCLSILCLSFLSLEQPIFRLYLPTSFFDCLICIIESAHSLLHVCNFLSKFTSLLVSYSICYKILKLLLLFKYHSYNIFSIFKAITVYNKSNRCLCLRERWHYLALSSEKIVLRRANAIDTLSTRQALHSVFLEWNERWRRETPVVRLMRKRRVANLLESLLQVLALCAATLSMSSMRRVPQVRPRYNCSDAALVSPVWPARPLGNEWEIGVTFWSKGNSRFPPSSPLYFSPSLFISLPDSSPLVRAALAFHLVIFFQS